MLPGGSITVTRQGMFRASGVGAGDVIAAMSQPPSQAATISIAALRPLHAGPDIAATGVPPTACSPGACRVRNSRARAR